ncbi:glycosyltransferase family 2 protein [Vibrio furnissii]|uniref:glycosyltransferase family 2 protein n=1 Tax=Vibrio furnissii TaxID=29494 RepID=UPI003AA98A7B
MLVSIVITTKNRYEMACRAIRSVLSQSYKDIEILVVNDGERFDFSSFEKVKVIENKESFGGGYARNLGVKNSIGDIIFFLDDDDYWHKNKVEKQVLEFIDERVGLVYTGRAIFYDDDESEIRRVIYPKEKGNLYPRILFENPIGVTSSVAIRRDIFEKVGGFDETLPCRQDYDLWIRVCKITRVSFINEALLYYRLSTKTGDQISNTVYNHEKALSILLKKYLNDIKVQGFLSERKIKSNLYFSVAKAHRRVGYLSSIKFIVKSMFLFPNIKSFFLFFPKFILNKVVSL